MDFATSQKLITLIGDALDLADANHLTDLGIALNEALVHVDGVGRQPRRFFVANDGTKGGCGVAG